MKKELNNIFKWNKLEFFKAVIDTSQYDTNPDTLYNSIREETRDDNIYVFINLYYILNLNMKN